jgi:histidine triad (HIT) family protein
VNIVALPDCLFCRIIEGSIPAEKVYEDDQLVVIRDINPAAPVHLLIIPKNHLASLNEVTSADVEILGKIQLTAAQIAREMGIAEQGFRLVNNCGDWGGQVIMHLHYHLLGGKQMGWPPE